MRTKLRGWHIGVISALVAAVTVGVGVTYAVSGVTTASGGAIAAVGVARGAFATDTTSTSFVALPGARVLMRGHGLLLIRFTAESECTGSGGSWCSVEVLVDGIQAKPASGFDFAFDTNDGEFWDGNAMDRSLKVGPGLHTIQVLYGVNSSGDDFNLDDWSLTVERAIA